MARNNIIFYVLSYFLFAGIFVSLLSAKDQGVSSFANTPWSIRMAQSDIARQPNGYKVSSRVWDYVIGVELKGLEQLWKQTNDSTYFKYLKKTVDAAVSLSGNSISGYSASAYTLDNINEGKAINFLYSATNDNRYKNAATLLRNQLKTHPRTSEGGFWHKLSYPYQMWLDGLYMAAPFWAGYGRLFPEPANYDSAVTQFVLVETHTRDSITGLLYHGWDEKKVSQWANPTTGCSPSFWGRAIGWYAMGLVDALDELPANHPGRTRLIAILQRLAVGIKRFQDSTHGTWYQVMDQGYKPDNWHESSASCMFVYALAKGVRLGYLDRSYLNVAKKGYTGILEEFITVNADSSINLTGVCSSAGLDAAVGGVRDGSYNYYVNNSGTQPVTNDGKGTGAFIMASIEIEQANMIPPLSTFALTLNAVNGIVTKNPDQALYDSASTVQLTATPVSGYDFERWTGDVLAGHETDNPLTMEMTSNKSLAAIFVEQTTAISLASGWNLISVPRFQSNDSSQVIFPAKLGSVFSYNSVDRAYEAKFTLGNNLGYWVNYKDTATITLHGSAPGITIVAVNQSGWILIGSSYKAVSLSSLVLSNGAAIQGSAFKYSATLKEYQTTTSINPGEACWLNINKPCTITF